MNKKDIYIWLLFPIIIMYAIFKPKTLDEIYKDDPLLGNLR